MPVPACRLLCAIGREFLNTASMKCKLIACSLCLLVIRKMIWIIQWSIKNIFSYKMIKCSKFLLHWGNNWLLMLFWKPLIKFVVLCHYDILWTKCSLLSKVSVTEHIITAKNAFRWNFLIWNMLISIHTGISGGGL